MSSSSSIGESIGDIEIRIEGVRGKGYPVKLFSKDQVFDGYSPAPAPTVVQPEPAASSPEPRQTDHSPEPEPARVSSEPESAQETEGAAARRRSTVREKVSFLASAQPEAPAPVTPSQPETPASAPAQTASETETDTQPRKAGWWSRRFGSGE